MLSILALLISSLLFLLEHKDVFLNGNRSCSGMVGVAQGTHTSWLSGSARTWNPEAADAVCQQLNCGTATSFGSILNQRMKKEIWNVAYDCSKNKTSLFACDNTSMPSDHRKTVAMVTCSGMLSSSVHLLASLRCCLFLLLWFPQQEASR